MGNKRPGMDRRQVLKLVMIGGVATAVVMPSKWVKPVVNAVIPPAHAAASAPSTTAAPEEATKNTAANPDTVCQNSVNIQARNYDSTETTGVQNSDGTYTCSNPGIGTWSTSL